MSTSSKSIVPPCSATSKRAWSGSSAARTVCPLLLSARSINASTFGSSSSTSTTILGGALILVRHERTYAAESKRIPRPRRARRGGVGRRGISGQRCAGAGSAGWCHTKPGGQERGQGRGDQRHHRCGEAVHHAREPER